MLDGCAVLRSALWVGVVVSFFFLPFPFLLDLDLNLNASQPWLLSVVIHPTWTLPHPYFAHKVISGRFLCAFMKHKLRTVAAVAFW